MVVQRVVPVAVAQIHTFSAPSVEPYGGSSVGQASAAAGSAFSAPSVEPYGGSIGGAAHVLVNADFQCSLCRAVWWFVGDKLVVGRGDVAFSAPSVEPYGGSREHSCG